MATPASTGGMMKSAEQTMVAPPSVPRAGMTRRREYCHNSTLTDVRASTAITMDGGTHDRGPHKDSELPLAPGRKMAISMATMVSPKLVSPSVIAAAAATGRISAQTSSS